MRYRYITIRMVKKTKQDKNPRVLSAGEGAGQHGLLLTADMNVNWYSYFGRQFGYFLQG